MSTEEHEPEKDFSDYVYDWLVEEYGEDNVEDNQYLKDQHPYDEESRRFADFWVEAPICDYAIEVENDFEAVMKGIGQVVIYGAHRLYSDNVCRVVIVPDGHVEHPEVDMMRQFFIVKEFSVEE